MKKRLYVYMIHNFVPIPTLPVVFLYLERLARKIDFPFHFFTIPQKFFDQKMIYEGGDIRIAKGLPL